MMGDKPDAPTRMVPASARSSCAKAFRISMVGAAMIGRKWARWWLGKPSSRLVRDKPVRRAAGSEDPSMVIRSHSASTYIQRFPASVLSSDVDPGSAAGLGRVS